MYKVYIYKNGHGGGPIPNIPPRVYAHVIVLILKIRKLSNSNVSSSIINDNSCPGNGFEFSKPRDLHAYFIDFYPTQNYII